MTTALATPTAETRLSDLETSTELLLDDLAHCTLCSASVGPPSR
jgi:hypothetical protein